MRILLITQYFRPQPLANAEVVGGLAVDLGRRGNRVDVVSPVPDAMIAPGVEPRPALGWFAPDRSSIVQRVVEYGSFSLGATLSALRAPKPDVVLVPSPPPTLGLIGLLVARLRRTPFVYNVQDLYPEVAHAVSAPPGLFIKVVRRIVSFIYNQADAVVVIDPMFVPIIERAAPKALVRAIRNGIDLQPFEDAARDQDYLESVGVPVGVPLVMYAGNVGRSQDLRAVIEATAASGAHLVIHGAGATLDAVRASITDAEHDHVHFSDFRPRSELGRVFASADLHVVPLRVGVAYASVPSKMLSIFAAGRPAVLGAEADSAAASVMAEAEGGWVVEPGDDQALSSAIQFALANRDELTTRGRSARAWAVTNAGANRAATEWEAVLNEVAERPRGGRRRR